MLSIGESVGYKTKVRDMIETREQGALRCKVDKERHLKIYGGLNEGIGMKAYLHGPLDAAKYLKLRLRVGTWIYRKGERDIRLTEWRMK